MMRYQQFATIIAFTYLFFAGMGNVFAQKKKELVIGIDTLLSQQQYEYAMPLLRLWLKEEPEDALATFRLGMTYHEVTKKLYVHQEEALRAEYDSAIKIYERSLALIDRKELRRNKDYYTVQFNTKDYTEGMVREMFVKQIDKLEDYYGRLAFLRLKLVPIMGAYQGLENSFRGIISRYPKIPELYKHSTEEDINILRDIQIQHKTLTQHIKAYEQVFIDNPELSGRHYQEFTFQPIEGINIYGIAAPQFKAKKLSLFDFGQWADQQLDKVYKFNKLRLKAEDFEKEILQFTSMIPVDTHVSNNRVLDPLNAWKQELLVYDQHAVVPDLLFYKAKKWGVMIEEEQVRDLFKRTYPDRETRNALIEGLTKKLLGLSNELKTINTDSSAYLTYRDFINKYYGGMGNLTQWKIIENNFITQRLMHWNSIRVKSASLPLRLPDFIYYTDKKLLLRPAKFNLTVAQDSGSYINEQIVYLPDSTFISQGRYGKSNTPYLAQLDTTGAILWMHDFPDTVEQANKITDLYIYPSGYLFYFAHREKEGVARISMEVLDIGGELIYSRIVTNIPQKIFYPTEPEGVIFLRETSEGDGQSGFSRFAVEGYSFVKDSKPIFTTFLLRGHIVNMLPYKGGLHLVANFLELQDAEGNFSDSRAYKQNGFNALTVNISLQKQKVKYNTIFSMIPIFVRSAALESDGKLRLTGLQGTYKYYGPGNITGGEPWIRYVTE